VTDPSATPAGSDLGLASALLERFERPTAVCDRSGRLVAMNAGFRREAERRGLQPDGGLVLVEGVVLDGEGRPVPLDVVSTELTTASLPGPDWRLLELPTAVVNLPTIARRFELLGGQPAALLQVELREQGGLLNRFGVEHIQEIVDGLEQRLLCCLPEDTSLCRSRGERLLALIPLQSGLEQLQLQAQRWQQELSAPLQLAQQTVQPLLSLGISRFPQDGQRFELLLEACNRALLSAHRQPKASVCIAAPLEHEQRQLRLLARPLAIAIDQERLRLLYQPIVEMATNRIKGVEVLCRWQDPLLGTISPTDFIAVAEATEQINLLGSWLIDAVFSQQRRWQDRGLQLDYVSINVSPLQLHHAGLVEALRQGLQRHRIQPGQVMLEMTENQTFQASPELLQRLWSLHELGFILAMDDYGTGYSGMQRLTSLPFRALKVDRCLIDAIDTDPLQQAVVRGVVDLQNSTGIRVVVEGVERPEQCRRLLDLGCRLGQGFLFSRPIPAQQVESWMGSSPKPSAKPA
jgi:EAL domain-containing protein (putative c-di-GMP-specific phosphodiesterase class I)/GGDEF domain-containing protein